MVLDKYFSAGIDQSSPVQKDYDRKVNYDEDGNEFITWEEVDYPKLIRSLGSVSDWSLNSLLKAGINPNFSISTGNPTRLEGLGVIDGAQAYVDALFAENENKE